MRNVIIMIFFIVNFLSCQKPVIKQEVHSLNTSASEKKAERSEVQKFWDIKDDHVQLEPKKKYKKIYSCKIVKIEPPDKFFEKYHITGMCDSLEHVRSFGGLPRTVKQIEDIMKYFKVKTDKELIGKSFKTSHCSAYTALKEFSYELSPEKVITSKSEIYERVAIAFSKKQNPSYNDLDGEDGKYDMSDLDREIRDKSFEYAYKNYSWFFKKLNERIRFHSKGRFHLEDLELVFVDSFYWTLKSDKERVKIWFSKRSISLSLK